LKKYENGKGQADSSNAQMHKEGADFLDGLSLQPALDHDLNQSMMNTSADGFLANYFDPIPSSSFAQTNPAEQQSTSLDDESLWPIIELGVEEPLPPQDTIDELYFPLL
jgi:hypothetical protein